MNRFLIIFSAITLFVSCSKKEEKSLSTSDSILAKPITENVPEAQPKPDSLTGLLIDQSRFYTPEQQALLNRFSPSAIVSIYHDFKSVRKPGISETQIDSFTKAKKISVNELKAILQEGDRRGWNK
jgi:hypothetical protein